jgi:hypothetical protein
VVRTHEGLALALALRHGRALVAAYVRERPQHVVLAPHDDDGLQPDERRHVRASVLDLVCATHKLPRAPKDAAQLRLRSDRTWRQRKRRIREAWARSGTRSTRALSRSLPQTCRNASVMYQLDGGVEDRASGTDVSKSRRIAPTSCRWRAVSSFGDSRSGGSVQGLAGPTGRHVDSARRV